MLILKLQRQAEINKDKTFNYVVLTYCFTIKKNALPVMQL